MSLTGVTLEQLKADLQLKHGLKLIDADNVKRAAGVSTGWIELDQFLTSGGFPCGELSLLEGAEGVGALTLWLETAARLTRNKHRVAWLNAADDDREPLQLHAPTAHQRGVDLQKLYLVNLPSRLKRAWMLQELLASQLFSLVGCDLGETHLPLREGRSLLMQARRSGAAVVLLSRRESRGGGGRESREPPAIRSLASLVLRLAPNGDVHRLEVVRAAHRPVPHNLPTSERGERHVDFITGSDASPHLELTTSSTGALIGTFGNGGGNSLVGVAHPRSRDRRSVD